MVLKRCAMTSAVRPERRRLRASRICNSVFVSTLDVASSRIRNRGLCASARAKLMSWRWPTESVEPRSLPDAAATSVNERGCVGQRADKITQADFLNSALNIFGRNVRRAEANVGFNRAGEEKRILQNDSEMPAQILQVQQANVD